jgi:hypothetical protein
MSKLPPGFTHELPQHLQQQEHGVFDEEKGVRVLDFDHFCCGSYSIASLTSTYDPDCHHRRSRIFCINCELNLVQGIKQS